MQCCCVVVRSSAGHGRCARLGYSDARESKSGRAMANILARWCRDTRTKLINGCKNLPIPVVLPVEMGEGKPSDCEELLGGPSQDEADSDNPRTPSPNQDNQFKFEELECDVSVEDSDSSGDRQEFSFTLYDFNGHGKITQDDIAGLVRTIYDAVGTTKLSPCGSKTIQVRLTVSSDKKTTDDDDCLNNSSSNHDLFKVKSGMKKESNVSLKEAANQDFKDNLRDVNVNLMSEHMKVTPEKRKVNSGKHVRYRHGSPDVYRYSVDVSPRTHKKKLQKQHLFDIIQSNMKKNNLNSPNVRRAVDESKQRHRHKYNRVECSDCCGECKDKWNYYMDLAGVDKPLPNNKSPRVHLKKDRSRSPGFLFRYHLATEPKLTNNLTCEELEWHHGRSKSYDAHSCSPKGRVPRNCYGGSPGHLHQQNKHKNREREHERAMRQVSEWLEREHINSRHEHHHVHEHVHHHYHHHCPQETTVL